MTLLVSIDAETHLIQPGLLAPPIVCGSHAHQFHKGDGGIGVSKGLLSADAWINNVAYWLEGEGLVFVGANIAYDFACVLAERPDLFPLVWKAYEEERVFDVLIAGTLDAIYDGRLRDGELFDKSGTKIQKGRYSLQTVVKDYLGRDDAKKNDRWRLSYALLEHLPIEQWPEDARQYPIDDAVNTLEVAEKQLRVCQNLHDLPRQAHAAFCAHLGAVWGLRTDPERVKAFKAEVDEHLKVTQAYGVEHGLMKPKWKGRKPNKVITGYSKDTKVIKERVFKAYDGLPPTTDSGDVSMARETLEDSGDPILEKFAEGSKWEKLHTYAETLSQNTSTPFNVACNILLSTGRASYEGLIQLMPRKGGVRPCFVARDENYWCSVDYNFVELVGLAQVHLWTVGHSKLADAINAGIDPHSLFAAEMTGVKYEEFLKRKGEPVESGLRQAAKAANFGFPGMMGAPKFVIAKKKEGAKVCEWLHRDGRCGEEKIRAWKGRDLDAPLCKRCVEEADKLRQAYIEMWPEMQPYWRWVTSQMGHTERLEQFVSKRVRGGLSGPAGANTLFQGLVADGAKKAVIELTKEMYLVRESPLFGSRLMIFSHDETIVEMRRSIAHEAAMRQAEIMRTEMQKYMPDVKVGCEPALMTRWYKDATPVYESGRLVPWEPEPSKA